LLAGLRHVEPGEPLKRELSHVVECVMNGRQPLCTAEDSIYALKVCLAALESIGSGKSVNIA
jgi:predicted dehydrogenase